MMTYQHRRCDTDTNHRDEGDQIEVDGHRRRSQRNVTQLTDLQNDRRKTTRFGKMLKPCWCSEIQQLANQLGIQPARQRVA